MINVEFYKTDGGWQGFRAHGHAGYADPGEDIVCAAVSILTQTAVLGLEQVLGVACQIQLDEAEGLLECALPQDLPEDLWKDAQLVLEVLYVGLRSTVEEYGDYVSVKEVPYRENKSAIVRHQKGRRKH